MLPLETKKELAARLMAKCSEARLELLEGVMADVMPPVEEWPRKHIEQFLGDHVGFNARCNLFYFLTVNGFPPSMWAKWAEAQPGWLRFDKSAEHIASLLLALMSGDFEGETGKELKTAWCLENKQVVTVYTPNFAREDIGSPMSGYISGASIFTDAIDGLKMYAKKLPSKKAYGRF